MPIPTPGRIMVCLLLLAACPLVATEKDAAPAEHVWRSLRPAPDLPRPSMKLDQRTIEISELRFRTGDNPDWARPDCDDLGWEVIRFNELPVRTGIFWVRLHLRVRSPELLPTGFRSEVIGAVEIFWDGERVAGSGVPGNSRAAEVPGLMTVFGTLSPGMRAAGEHVVAIRMSNHRNGFPSDTSTLGFLLLYPEAYQAELHWQAVYSALAGGACLMLAMAAGLMWLFAARRPAVLLLGGLCLSAAVVQGVATGRAFLYYRYDWYHVIVNVRLVAGALAGAMLLGFVTTQFGLRRRAWWFAALPLLFGAAVWLTPVRTVQEDKYFLAGCVSLALAVAGWAILRRKRGARLAAGGLCLTVALLLFAPMRYVGPDFLWMFLPAAAGLISALALDINDERERARQAQLTSARLEIELLKKNLQPHFLLNTLTALMEVIEQNPREAVLLVEDLAGEFRMLAGMAAEKTVPLARELELCRAHLRVMSVRTGRGWDLAVVGVDEAAPVPPAVFLTLIENGFIHQRRSGENGVFRLRMDRPGEDGTIRYTFLSPGVLPAGPARPAGGTGLRYVKARLEESFPGRWTFRDGQVPAGWETVIEIRPL